MGTQIIAPQESKETLEARLSKEWGKVELNLYNKEELVWSTNPEANVWCKLARAVVFEVTLTSVLPGQITYSFKNKGRDPVSVDMAELKIIREGSRIVYSHNLTSFAMGGGDVCIITWNREMWKG